MRRKKKESEKSLKSFVISHILCTFVPNKESLKQAGGSASGVHQGSGDSDLFSKDKNRKTEVSRLPFFLCGMLGMSNV